MNRKDVLGLKNRDRERLSTAVRVGALVIAAIMVIGFIFQSFIGIF